MIVPPEFLFFGAIALCTYFSFRSGQNTGREQAVDSVFTIIESMNDYVRVERTNNGDIKLVKLSEDASVQGNRPFSKNNRGVLMSERDFYNLREMIRKLSRKVEKLEKQLEGKAQEGWGRKTPFFFKYFSKKC